jgi:hypothetical protein
MYSVADMSKIFLSTNNVTDYQNDLHQYFEQNAPNRTVINYEEEGSVMSEPMSLSSSPVATDIQTGNCVHNHKESSERRDNGLCSIYEIRILYVTVIHQHLNCHISQFHSTLLHFIVIPPLKSLSHRFQFLYKNHTVQIFLNYYGMGSYRKFDW